MKCPDVPDDVSLWGLILPLRQEVCGNLTFPKRDAEVQQLRQCINLRPIRGFQSTIKPRTYQASHDIDWVLIRENSEGEYAGQGGISHKGTPDAVATEVAIFTRRAIERTMRFAFETARSRPRKKLTMVTKSNAQRYGLVLWDSVFHSLASEYPEVQVDSVLVDAMTVRMVNNPRSLDTVVTTNLHGDILSDLAAALAGSIGIAPSGNINPDRTTPSMFEPIHGSAPDIAGQGIANPIGMIWSAAEMLTWLGEDRSASRIMRAVTAIVEQGVLTKDLGGSASMLEVRDAVLQNLSRSQNFVRAQL